MPTFARATPLCALIAIAAVACNPAASAAPATVAPTTAAVATAPSGPPEPCADNLGDSCPIIGGTIHAPAFDDGVTLTLAGDNWTNSAYEHDVMSFDADDDRIVFVSGAVKMQGTGAVEDVDDPTVAQTILATKAALKVTPKGNVTIGGLSGAAFDVQNTGTEAVVLWSYPETTGDYALKPGTTTRLHWISGGGEPFIVAIEAPTPRFELFLSDMAATLASLKFD